MWCGWGAAGRGGVGCGDVAGWRGGRRGWLWIVICVVCEFVCCLASGSVIGMGRVACLEFADSLV